MLLTGASTVVHVTGERTATMRKPTCRIMHHSEPVAQRIVVQKAQGGITQGVTQGTANLMSIALTGAI